MSKKLKLSKEVVDFLKSTGMAIDHVNDYKEDDDIQLETYCYIPYWFQISKDGSVEMFERHELPEYIESLAKEADKMIDFKNRNGKEEMERKF